MFSSKEFPWQITSITKDGGLTNIVELSPKFSGEFKFQAGQGAFFNFPKIRGLWHSRFFHFISSPLQENFLQIAIRIKDDWTHNTELLTEGDIALCTQPVGTFQSYDFKSRESLRRRVFLAGGVGITPFLAMLENASLIEPTRQITVLWGAENHDDLIQKERMLYLTQNMPNLTVIPFLTHDPLWKGEKGRLDIEKLKTFVPKSFGFNEESWLWNSGATEYWINGPKGFSHDLQKCLKILGVSRRYIHVERQRY